MFLCGKGISASEATPRLDLLSSFSSDFGDRAWVKSLLLKLPTDTADVIVIREVIEHVLCSDVQTFPSIDCDEKVGTNREPNLQRKKRIIVPRVRFRLQDQLDPFFNRSFFHLS